MSLCVAWAQGDPGNNPSPPTPPGGRPGGPPPFMPRPEELDANQDGNVTWDEYSAAWNKVIEKQFKRLDANGDGVLSKEELAKGYGPGHGPGPGGNAHGRPGLGDQGGAGEQRY